MTAVERLGARFPLFESRDVAYLDNAATTQKPRRVIDAVAEFYEGANANPHRGAYDLASGATDRIERARESYADCLGCRPDEVVFTRNATEALNQLAAGLRPTLGDGAVAVTAMEHHSNFLPWQRVAETTGAGFTVVPYDGIERAHEHVPRETDVFAVSQLSNVTGRLVDVEELARAVTDRSDAFVVVDGCQAFPHVPVDVSASAVDAYVLSAHKHYGPTGVGVAYVGRELQERLRPPLVGGGMVEDVSERSFEPNSAPHRFEAGTVNAAGVVGSETALRFLSERRNAVAAHEQRLRKYALRRLDEAGIDYLGHDDDAYRAVISLDVDRNPYDVRQVLNAHDVCVRAGDHCAQPLLDELGVAGTVRVSLGAYNTEADVDRCLRALREAEDLLGPL